jgi:hypothetical protein
VSALFNAFDLHYVGQLAQRRLFCVHAKDDMNYPRVASLIFMFTGGRRSQSATSSSVGRIIIAEV